MNHKVRNQFALAAVGALACSLAAAPAAMASPDGEPTLPGTSAGDFYGRIAGQSRFGTAVEASKALQGNHGDTVIIANFNAWSDTLAATPLADALDAPVLYTYWNRLEATTIQELKRLKEDGVENVIVLGGELAVQEGVIEQLRDLRVDAKDDEEDAFIVDRIGGQSRYDTALLLSAEAVDYYENDGMSLSEARETLAAQAQADAVFTQAQKDWTAARAATAMALKNQQAAQAKADAANKALADLTGQLVVVPALPGTINGTSVANLDEANGVIAGLENVASDAGVVAAFINARVAGYVGEPGNIATDMWSEVIDANGDYEYTIPLKSRADISGTLAQISTELGINSNNTVRAVADNAAAAKANVDAVAAAARAEYAAYVAAINAQVQANEANAALRAKISAAVDAVTAAQTALTNAGVAYAEAAVVEADAKAAFDAAVLALPTATARIEAQVAYDAALKANLAAGTKYPAFLATGLDFPDALAAGPAAADQLGVVLLTRGAQMTPATQSYLDSGAAKIAVGGPAAAAAPDAAKKFVGYSRYETATKLAAAYFDDTKYIGLASGAVAADAVSGGALMANLDGTLVLTKQSELPDYTASFLSFSVEDPTLVIFGGQLAISTKVKDEAIEALQG